MRLILVRHGHTGSHKYTGVTDLPLSEEGRWQAQMAGQRLADEPVEKIFCSGLQRAIETAKIINLSQKIELEIMPDLGEINFGLWEGLAYAEIPARYPDEFREWMNGTSDFRFPQGESIQEVRRRVLKALERIKSECRDRTVAMVAHGGPIKVILCEVLGLDLASFWRIKLDWGGISEVKIESARQSVIFMNETRHLRSGFNGQI
jgi:alpha-ribazole phosphatase